MEKQPHNIQDVFLNHLRREKLPVTVFLMSGVKLTGRIKSFDKYAVILESGQRDQLIFKHAISTVVTTKSAPAAAAPSAPFSTPPSTTTKASDPEPSD
ncbi:MAG: RNA chaperone Hfq [Acidobacteriota bacterium]|nr:RNA chaperone Hfq [Acidobacteriota bacterium]MDE2965326.1 RNA chaperone Hfq [Acidobacteriota bacterium]